MPGHVGEGLSHGNWWQPHEKDYQEKKRAHQRSYVFVIVSLVGANQSRKRRNIVRRVTLMLLLLMLPANML